MATRLRAATASQPLHIAVHVRQVLHAVFSKWACPIRSTDTPPISVDLLVYIMASYSSRDSSDMEGTREENKGCFIVLNKAPYPFMEIDGKFDDPGSLIMLGGRVGDKLEHQRWKFIEAEGMPGAYYIKPAGDVGRPLVLTVTGGVNCSRPSLQHKYDVPNRDQLWLLCAPQGGSIGRCIMNYRHGLVLDANDNNTSPGTPVMIYKRHNYENQQWYLDARQ